MHAPPIIIFKKLFIGKKRKLFKLKTVGFQRLKKIKNQILNKRQQGQVQRQSDNTLSFFDIYVIVCSP